MKSEYRIGKVWGIPINLHISLFLLMGYLALQSGLTGLASGGLLGGVFSIVFILVFEILLFTSIALHELGHSFVAIRKGCRVREITLMFIGGAAKMEQMPRRPLDEFLMAVAGPAVSVMLGTAAIAASIMIPKTSGEPLAWLSYLLKILGLVNLILAGFNLLPAFPMDGGRIFRAMLTPKLGRLQATRVAAQLGKAVAVLFVLVGLFGLPGVPFFENRNLFMILIAGFVYFNGSREYRMVQIEELMRNRGFGAAPPPFRGDGADAETDDDTVLISPPPYEHGPVRRTEIRREQDNPLRDLFGR